MPLILTLSLLMLVVWYTDATRYTIPNWLNATLLLLYPLSLWLYPGQFDWLSGLYAFAATLALGFALFAFGVMGAGDVKLLAVLALWCGLEATLAQFIVYTGMLGGALTLLLVLLRPRLPWLWGKLRHPPPIPQVLTLGQPVPYGLAIAGAFLWLLWNGKIITL